jgi:hypothetical protein
MLKTASDPRRRGRMRAWLAAGVLIAPAILAAPLWYVIHGALRRTFRAVRGADAGMCRLN